VKEGEGEETRNRAVSRADSAIGVVIGKLQFTVLKTEPNVD
jgi:hypothetical protein